MYYAVGLVFVCFGVVVWEAGMFTVLNPGRYTGISAGISVFYLKRYDKYKILPDIILD